MGKKSRRTKDPWLREQACEQWYRRRVGSATTTNRHALTMLRLVAITMHSMYHLPGSLAACFGCVCACILHGAARKSTVQATEAGTKVQVNGLSKDTQFNGRIGHITGDTTPDGRVGVKIMGGKMLAVKIENLEVVGDHDTGFTSYQEAAAASSSEVHKSDLQSIQAKMGSVHILQQLFKPQAFHFPRLHSALLLHPCC